MKASKRMLQALGFGQPLALVGGSAVGQFADPFCQTDPQSLQCFDAGCADLGGKCEPRQAQLPPGQTDQPDEQQGCVCDTPFEPQKQCEFVHDEHGEQFCADLGCPPLQGYNCDPVTCNCEEPQDFGDEKCQPNPQDPTMCQDLGCSAMGPGWECEPTQGQEPHPPGEPQEGIGGCKCKSPDDPQGTPHCDVVFPFPPGPPPFCIDFDCGAMPTYDCAFIPEEGVCDCICDTIVPGPELFLIFTTKIDFEWFGPGSLCANVYNVYREDSQYLTDVVPPFKVADFYGFCFLSGLLVSHAQDFAVPPASIVQHYLVTSESPAGESPLGFTSAPTSALRPNTSPCPSPPPLP